MPRLATMTCLVLGALFAVAGALTAVFGDAEDQHHNLLHLATGLVALVAAVSVDRSAARTFCIVFGAGYLVFGGLGFVAGDEGADHLLHVGVLHLASAEHVFHLVLGAVVLAAGLVTASRSAVGPHVGDRRAASRVVVAGLVAAAAGVVTMALSGVVFTTAIPPGLLILLIPAGLVATGRRRWPPLVAAAAAGFIVVGYFPSGAAAQLLELTGSSAFVGLWLQLAGASVAVVAGVVATAQDYRDAPSDPIGVTGRTAG